MRFWSREGDPAVANLRKRLDSFYQESDNNYQAFESISRQDDYWGLVIQAIRRLNLETRENRQCRVLEFGAGRTGFADALGALRKDVYFAVQDVTVRNKEHLREVADRVYLGDVSSIDASFDVIFSTFVWEHVTHPEATLETLLQRLEPGGSLFLICPRYDWLGYVPPALRHLGRSQGLWLSLWLQLSRLPSRLRAGAGTFWIVKEPAVFHTPTWFRDSDAVHLVSRGDLRSYLQRRDLSIRDCWPDKGSFRANLLERALKLCVEIRKP
ncbi:hypothetical protein THIOKS1940007 [Thiocapsa sp. KS1]|nr:class I SAM-dependent methyltransferase [Thiocapsa sp. KS1]CRI68129.1 hypothetical protein THIOKS1940007 [Thiocapsa sp. KS1]